MWNCFGLLDVMAVIVGGGGCDCGVVVVVFMLMTMLLLLMMIKLLLNAPLQSTNYAKFLSRKVR